MTPRHIFVTESYVILFEGAGSAVGILWPTVIDFVYESVPACVSLEQSAEHAADDHPGHPEGDEQCTAGGGWIRKRISGRKSAIHNEFVCGQMEVRRLAGSFFYDKCLTPLDVIVSIQQWN